MFQNFKYCYFLKMMVYEQGKFLILRPLIEIVIKQWVILIHFIRYCDSNFYITALSQYGIVVFT